MYNTIFNFKELPELEAHQNLTCLVINNEETDADRCARRLFDELLTVVNSTYRLRHGVVLAVATASEYGHHNPTLLPQVINGASYSGVEQIQALLDRYQEIAKHPEIA